MPTYDYRCEACGHEHEAFQSITANPLRKCPNCGKLKLKRLIGTGAGIIFKGSGFYETDYRSDSYKKAAKAESEKASGKSEKSDAKKDKTSSLAKADSGSKGGTKTTSPSASKND